MVDTIICDTSLFIGIDSMEMLEDLFGIPISVHTTDMVISELEQTCCHSKIDTLLRKGRLFVDTINENQMPDVLAMRHRTISIVDCSVLFTAKENGWLLLSGDKLVRNLAASNGIRAYDQLYIMDELVSRGLIQAAFAADLLEKLCANSSQSLSRSSDVMERINKWTCLT